MTIGYFGFGVEGFSMLQLFGCRLGRIYIFGVLCKGGHVSGMLCDADTNFNPFGTAQKGYCRCMEGGARVCS